VAQWKDTKAALK